MREQATSTATKWPRAPQSAACRRRVVRVARTCASAAVKTPPGGAPPAPTDGNGSEIQVMKPKEASCREAAAARAEDNNASADASTKTCCAAARPMTLRLAVTLASIAEMPESLTREPPERARGAAWADVKRPDSPLWLPLSRRCCRRSSPHRCPSRALGTLALALARLVGVEDALELESCVPNNGGPRENDVAVGIDEVVVRGKGTCARGAAHGAP